MKYSEAKQGRTFVIRLEEDDIIHEKIEELARVHSIEAAALITVRAQTKVANWSLHMHIACGREESTVTGCVRRGVNVWHLLEIILFELVDSSACRMFDELLGFELLEQ